MILLKLQISSRIYGAVNLVKFWWYQTHRGGGADPDSRCCQRCWGSLGDHRLTLLQLGLSLGQSLLRNQDQLTRLGPDQNHTCRRRIKASDRRDSTGRMKQKSWAGQKSEPTGQNGELRTNEIKQIINIYSLFLCSALGWNMKHFRQINPENLGKMNKNFQFEIKLLELKQLIRLIIMNPLLKYSTNFVIG